jgi:UDP-N-acetylglucosamine--N-acetylmuramyl-(pentapeptide) pyrophosphoryl-undecaprenol N-acetylglucosamine transferase
MSRQIRVIISGGGTGGHIFPALAIADALRMEDPSIDILFIGAQGRMEMQKVPLAGYPIKGLWISGFQRSLSWRNLLFPLRLVVSFLQVIGILLRFRPDMVIGVGGYASGPTVFSSRLFGIYTAIQEQNAWPGVTNRILGKMVHRIYTAYEGMQVFFPEGKLRCLGNPVRMQLKAISVSREEAMQHYGLDSSKKTILIFGGSLGAGIFNQVMKSGKEKIMSRAEDIQWIWQCGKSYYDDYAHCETTKLPNVWFAPFIDDMEKAYVAADLVVSRAGAMTIAELALLGKPAILTPSPFVAEDHQTRNAKALSNREAVELVVQKEATEKLLDTAMELVMDEVRLDNLGKNIRAMAFEDASGAIARDLIYSYKNSL